MKPQFSVSVLAALMILLLAACGETPEETLPREELFSIALGKMEDQIDLFLLPQLPFPHKTSIYMQDGTFYIASGSSFKVLEFSSYGDLLNMYYNTDENPKPVMLQASTESNRRAYPYSFRQVGEIAVSSTKVLYVEDRLPDERVVYDEKLGIVLNRIVLRFQNGEYQGYLGQEGLGGTPFPFIQKLEVSKQDEVVVLCRSTTSWILYWYSPSGELISTLNIPLDRLPAPAGEGIFTNLDKIIPDPEERALYLKLDYYQEGRDSSTGIKYGIEDISSRIYRLNVDSAQYEGFVEIPKNVHRVRGSGFFETREEEHLYEFLGVSAGGRIFLRSRGEGDSHQLLILRRDGKVLQKSTITVEDSQLLFSVFHLSPRGILSALLASDTGAKVVWWRSDNLLGLP